MHFRWGQMFAKSKIIAHFFLSFLFFKLLHAMARDDESEGVLMAAAKQGARTSEKIKMLPIPKQIHFHLF